MHIFMNNVKTALLLGMLFGLLLWVGSFWGTGGMIFAGCIALVMNLGAWFNSDRVAIAAMRGVEATDANYGPLVKTVEVLAKRADLPMPRVYVCPQAAPNAFATGRNPRHAAVAVTQGALELLDRPQMEGVIAHELAHIKNRDTLISMIAATFAGVFSMLASPFMLFGASRREGNPLMLIAVVLISALGAVLIKAAISRSREFVADADGARIAGSPDGLASALRTLHNASSRVPMRNPNPAMNNLFIVEPFMGSKTLGSMMASHPPLEDRLKALYASWEGS